MNVSLYEISADFLKALDGLEVNEETGEITNFDAVEALNAQFEDKAESVACYIKNLTAFVADLKTEEDALAARRKMAERRVDSVKKYLTSCIPGVRREYRRLQEQGRTSSWRGSREGLPCVERRRDREDRPGGQ